MDKDLAVEVLKVVLLGGNTGISSLCGVKEFMEVNSFQRKLMWLVACVVAL